jgi:hypothetical protein
MYKINFAKKWSRFSKKERLSWKHVQVQAVHDPSLERNYVRFLLTKPIKSPKGEKIQGIFKR